MSTLGTLGGFGKLLMGVIMKHGHMLNIIACFLRIMTL
jgi:hypothetical protein